VNRCSTYGLPVEPEDPRLDDERLPQFQRLAERDRLGRDHRIPAALGEDRPDAVPPQQVEPPDVGDREVHAVVHVLEDVEVRRHHPEARARHVPMPEARAEPGEQRVEHRPEDHVHAVMLVMRQRLFSFVVDPLQGR
jgi:hypothetical protein